jgi:PAS domain-containing protein
MLTDTLRSSALAVEPLRLDRTSGARRESITRAAASLRLGDTALDALVDRLPVGVALVDATGHTTYEHAAARRWGLDRLRDVRTAVARALRTNAPVCDAPIETHRVDGAQQWLAVAVRPVRGADGRARAATVTVVDVSDRTQLAMWEPTIEALTRM